LKSPVCFANKIKIKVWDLVKKQYFFQNITCLSVLQIFSIEMEISLRNKRHPRIISREMALEKAYTKALFQAGLN
jgi:hypothetical protein